MKTKYLLALCVSLLSAALCASGSQQLHGHVPPITARLQSKGLMSRSEHLHLAIGLPLRDQDRLSNSFAAIYDPASSEFHRYLTPEQFTEQFGPSEADYQNLQDFVKANGLTVSGTHPNRVVLEVDGTVASIESMLHVSMRTYDHPTDARTFYAPDREPTLDLAVPVLHISGLDNFRLSRPKLIHPDDYAARDDQSGPKGGTGPSGNYIGPDFRKAYLPGVTLLNGQGQSVGLVQFDSYYPVDITNYATTAGTPVPSITIVPIQGGITNVNENGANDEVSLDIEMVMAMAPGISNITLYEAPLDSTSAWDTMISDMLTNTACKQFSCSYGGPGPNPTVENLWIQMGMQGQSFFDASGDQDSFLTSGDINWPGFPSDSPNITQVGGTQLFNTNNGVYLSESVWNFNTTNRNGGYQGSSGGYATDTLIPIYQVGISNASNLASTNNRNVPDVAMTAQSVFIDFGNGKSGGVAGTSCASPLWAGFMANVNQEAARLGKPSAGFINPAVYALGQGLTYTGSFHDITNGNNAWPNHPTNFQAVVGYDLATGWGSPTGMHTVDALIGLDSPIGTQGDVWVKETSTCPPSINPDCTSGKGPATNMTTALTFVSGPQGGTLFLNGTGHISRIAQKVSVRAINGPARIQP